MGLMRRMSTRTTVIRPIGLMCPIRPISTTPHLSPQRPDRACSYTALQRGAHGYIHISAEGGFDCDVEAAVAEGEAWLYMLSGGDADTASAINTFAGFVHEPAGMAFAHHVLT